MTKCYDAVMSVPAMLAVIVKIHWHDCRRLVSRAEDAADVSADLDDTVGAFVRVIQEAPAELHQGGEQEQVIGERSRMTLQGGLAQLSALKAQLEAM